jgi:hypothetical protein
MVPSSPSELAARGYVEVGTSSSSCAGSRADRYEQLARLAAELVDLKVDVIVTYATPGVSAATVVRGRRRRWVGTAL